MRCLLVLHPGAGLAALEADVMPPASDSFLAIEPPPGLSDGDVDRWFHAIAELDAIRYRANRPPTPSRFALKVVAHKQKGDAHMGKSFEYDLGSWATPTDADVVARRVKVLIDGTAQPDADVPLDQAVYTITGVKVGQKVEATYSFVDDAGLASPPSPALSFTCVDDVAPAAPTGDGFEVVGHRQVETP